MEALYTDLNNYLNFLTGQGLSVSLHDRCGFMQAHLKRVLAYTIHSCPYCMQIKADKRRWNACHIMQSLAARKCREGRAFFGFCYAGVGEYVFPVLAEGKVIAFVSVGGYRTAEQFERLRLSSFVDEKILGLYQSLKGEIPKEAQISAVVKPICRMLELIYEKSEFISPVSMEKNYVYSHIVAFIEQHYQERITLEDICCFCHYSPSYVSHMFKKESGMTLGTYINHIRIKHAKRLLQSTDMRIRDIAAEIGFEEPNYFAGVFKRITGMTANTYRKQYRPLRKGVDNE